MNCIDDLSNPKTRENSHPGLWWPVLLTREETCYHGRERHSAGKEGEGGEMVISCDMAIASKDATLTFAGREGRPNRAWRVFD
jgi:hypothetical protein